MGEIPFPHAGDTQVLSRADEGEEVARGIAVGLGEVPFKVHGPLLAQDALQKTLRHGLDPLFHFFQDLFVGFVRYKSLSSFLSLVFWEGCYAAPRTHFPGHYLLYGARSAILKCYTEGGGTLGAWYH